MIELLRKVPLFQNLSDEQLQSLASLCSKKTYQAGTILCREKESGDVFYILLSGSVKIFTSNRNGEEKILSVLKAGENFGELSLIDGKPRSASAQTLEDSALYALTGEAFFQVMQGDFTIAREIMKELCQRLRDTNQHVQDLTFLDARSRVLKNLIFMANKHGKRNQNKVHIRLMLDYHELSRMAGVSQNELTTVLRDLETMQILSYEPEGFALDLTKLSGKA